MGDKADNLETSLLMQFITQGKLHEDTTQKLYLL